MARSMGAQVAMVNSVGEDSYGDETLANFARYGIDTTHVIRSPGASGVAPIWVEADGSNRIIVVPGANAGLTPERAAAAVAQMERVDAVIGQFEIDQAVTTAGFVAARARGATTILNPAPGAGISRGTRRGQRLDHPQRDGVRHHRASRWPAVTTSKTW